MAGSPDEAGSHDVLIGDGNLPRDDTRQHAIYAPLVSDFLGASRRGGKRATLARTLRVRAGHRALAWSAFLKHLDFRGLPEIGQHHTLRQSWLVKAAVPPMACAEDHVVAATGNQG